MNDQDELQDIWHSEGASSTARGEDVVASVQKRMRRFDRTVWIRNLVECIAGVVGFGIFIWLATHTPDTVMKAGALIVAASAAWIVFYLVRYGKSGRAPDPSQNLDNYAHALLDRYDRQIRLLRSAKYWYLLPMYVGVLTISAGVFLQRSKAGSLSWWSVADPVFSTALFGVIWWLNEVVGVRRLQQSRSKTLSMTGVDEFQDEFPKEEQR